MTFTLVLILAARSYLFFCAIFRVVFIIVFHISFIANTAIVNMHRDSIPFHSEILFSHHLTR